MTYGTHDLATRIRAIRKSKSLTMAEVEAACGVAASTVSKIENGVLSPTYANLLRLASGLGVDIVQLLDSGEAAPKLTRRSITRKGEGPLHSIGSHEYRLLNTDITSKKMLPLLVTIKAGSFSEVKSQNNSRDKLFRHTGEEVLFVVSGAVTLHTEHYAPTGLGPGDTAYIDSTMGHICLRASEEDAIVFWVCSSSDAIRRFVD